MEEIRTILTDLEGVISVAEITFKHRKEILGREENYERGGIIGLSNPGIRTILERDMVVSILKSSSFRPPPGPTVFMAEEADEGEPGDEYTITVSNKRYRIVGKELLGESPPKNEEYIYIGDDFILFPERRKGRTGKPAFFLIPPIKFPELENKKDILKIENILSVSPSTLADDFIREKCGFSKRNDLATILIGFDKTT